MDIHGYPWISWLSNIHGYPRKNDMDMDMDMDGIFLIHGKPVIFSLTSIPIVMVDNSRMSN